jgi:hypothetical protein
VNAHVSRKRVVLVHYHLFKNAGTTLDHILKRNFGERWGSVEAAQGDGKLEPEELAAFIAARPELCSVSSHTALLPVPLAEAWRVMPLVILRNPVDRIRSAYEFERKQNADTAGSQVARAKSFGDYIAHFLDLPSDRRFRNFQTARLARAVAPGTDLTEFCRAQTALEALSWVGIVEDLAHSLELLERRVRAAFPDFRRHDLRVNTTTAAESTLADRLAQIRSDLGRDEYRRLCNANMNDWALWERGWRLIRTSGV